MPDNQFIPPGVGNNMPVALVTPNEANTLNFDYFDTIPQSSNIGLGMCRSDFTGSGFFIDDAGWIYMVSGQSGSAVNILSSGAVSVHAGTGQDILLYGNDVKLNGASIVGAGSAPYPDITDVAGKIGINQTSPPYFPASVGCAIRTRCFERSNHIIKPPSTAPKLLACSSGPSSHIP